MERGTESPVHVSCERTHYSDPAIVRSRSARSGVQRADHWNAMTLLFYESREELIQSIFVTLQAQGDYVPEGYANLRVKEAKTRLVSNAHFVA